LIVDLVAHSESVNMIFFSTPRLLLKNYNKSLNLLAVFRNHPAGEKKKREMQPAPRLVFNAGLNLNPDSEIHVFHKSPFLTHALVRLENQKK
jgi:hypothetical protein